MSLAELQRSFQAYLLVSDPTIADTVTAQGQRGLPVYHHAYRATLKDALRDTYARTAAWLGDDLFDQAADDYIAATGSHSWTLGDYGTDFADHLERRHPTDPEIGELAWLEGALRAAFSVAEHSPLAADLTKVDWDRAVLHLAPGVAARRITRDVVGLWHALGEDRVPEAAETEAAEAEVTLGLIIWRAGLSPQFRTADAQEADLLMAIAGGASFADACAGLSDADPAAVGGWLAGWLRDGLIAGIVDPRG